MTEDVKESIGGILKRRREELGYSLKDAAERTRIRKSYIESLEEDRFSGLPGGAYVTGFIKVYAGYLGLDPMPLLALLEETETMTAPAASLQKRPAQTQNIVVKEKSGSGRGAFFIGFILVLVIGGGLYYLFAADDSTTPRESQPIAELEKTVEEKVPEPVAARDVEQAPVAKPETPVVESEAPATEVAKPADVSAEAQEEPGKDEEPLAIIRKAGSSLRMLAISQGSLIITVDQREPHEYVLHEGLDLTWKVKDKVSFKMAEAEQARFWLDGKELKLGDRKSLDLIQAP